MAIEARRRARDQREMRRIRRELRDLNAWQATAQVIISDNRDGVEANENKLLNVVAPELQNHEARIAALEP